MKLNITGGFYESDSLPLSAQRLVNAYVDVPQTLGALSEEAIFASPGITQLATTGTLNEENRGAWVMAGLPYIVNGDTLYTLADDNTFAALGTITGSGRVSMADNGIQLCVLVPGGDGFIYNKDTTTFLQITDLDFTANGNPQHVVFNDGYFVFGTDTKKFIISSLNDGLTYDALDFGTAEADPDPIVAPWTFNNRLYMMGSETIEPFRNVPQGAAFPFQRIEGGILNKGLFAPFTLVDGQNHFYWIGGGLNERPAIYRSAGNTPEKVSTTAIDKQLQQLTDDQIEDIVGWAEARDGAFFIGFRLPDEGPVKTAFVYNENNNRWHERTSRFVDTDTVTKTVGWRVSAIITAFDRTIVTDTLDGRVGELDSDVFTEYEQTNVQRELITMPFNNQMDTFFLPAIELTMESGVGNTDIPDPKIRLSISRDGKTFSPERVRKMGKVGNYKRRIIWRSNGRVPRLAVFKWEFSEPCKFVIIRADAKIRAGNPRYAA